MLPNLGPDAILAHATTLTEEDRPAFVHALALARALGTRLASVHANAFAQEGCEFPDPALLEGRWGPRKDGRATPHVTMAHTCCEDVVNTLLDALGRVGPALVVAGSTQKKAFARLMSGSTTEALAANLRCPLLVVPHGIPGLVRAEDGAIVLERICVPAGDAEATRLSVETAEALVAALGLEAVPTTLLHVEDGTPAPGLDVDAPHLRLSTKSVKGSFAEAAAESAEGASLVVMTTRGHDGLFDALVGSHTDRILRAVHAPVLVLPLDD